MSSIALSAVAGLALVTAYPPSGLGWVATVAIAAHLWSVRRVERPRVAWMAGAAFGAAFFGFLFPWIAELGVVAFLPLLVVQTLFPMAHARLLYRARHVPPVRWWMTAVGGWAAMELLRLRVPFGGFGWGLAGHPMGEYRAARAATQFIGTTGWSVLVVALAGAVVVLAVDRVRSPLVGAVVVLVAFVALGAVRPPEADGDPVRVAIVQGSTPCPQQRCPGERAEIYRSHLELTRRIAPGDVDLIVWPEGSSGFSVDPILDPRIAAEMGAEARRIGAVLLAGGDRPISDTEWVNANVVFGPDGEIIGEYQKRHPVPFGEYIPLRPAFAWIPDLSRVPRDMVRAESPVVFDVDFGSFGSVISFESVFSRYARDTVNAGAELLVVATSQASYPFSDASDQLIGITRMRSAELGVDVVHAAVTGRSTFITDGGRIGETTDLVAAEVITAEVHLRAGGPTFYAVAGDWLQVLAIVALGVMEIAERTNWFDRVSRS